MDFKHLPLHKRIEVLPWAPRDGSAVGCVGDTAWRLAEPSVMAVSPCQHGQTAGTADTLAPDNQAEPDESFVMVDPLWHEILELFR